MLKLWEGSETEDTPKTLEDGGYATACDLKNLNIGTIEESHDHICCMLVTHFSKEKNKNAS